MVPAKGVASPYFTSYRYQERVLDRTWWYTFGSPFRIEGGVITIHARLNLAQIFYAYVLACFVFAVLLYGVSKQFPLGRR